MVNYPSFNLSERDQQVLTAIIEIYIKSAEPVSSSQVCKQYQLSCSSATVRNSMLRLEEQEYLNHPYTSSGKCPTGKAYEFFIKKLMSKQMVKDIEQKAIQQQLMKSVYETDRMICLTARVLAMTSELMAVAWITSPVTAKLSGVQLIRLNGRQLLLIAHLDNGEVHHQTFDPGNLVSHQILTKVMMIVNENAKGLRAHELEKLSRSNWEGLDKNIFNVLKKALILLGEGLIKRLEQENVILEGTANLISQPEFDNIIAARQTITAIEEKTVLIQYLKEPGIKTGGTTVLIGIDNPGQTMPVLSIISKKVFLNDGRSACLGIVGPRRMAYNRLVPLMDYTTAALRKVVCI